MIITDIQGDKLNLTKTQLIETKSQYSAYPFLLNLSDLKKSYSVLSFDVLVYGKDMLGNPHKVKVDSSGRLRKLGCRYFSPVAFAKIIKAAGIVIAPARKAKRKAK